MVVHFNHDGKKHNLGNLR